ncbi:hypothetical protein PDJAM_G00214290 [Pangasius djambal]|uniref:Uncharacterized protein n=1 Tax=Pangasius djambal TaxID=1691987 RepID=A0ACC5YAC4_9TELE|nr:hypothetical protein [Pangasius djambal]
MLHSPVAHWWSSSGSRLAFFTINDTLVPNMLLPRFTGALYPQGTHYPYPKAGQINPTVKLNVVTLNGSSPTIELLPPSSLEKSQYYISMVRWVTEERVAVRWLNRAQNTSILTLCYTHTGECERSTDGEVNVRHLTSGNWEVTKVLAYDESLNAV